MDEFTERAEVPNRLHQLESDVDGMRGDEPDPLHARNLVESVEKVVKEAVPFGFVLPVAIDVLAEEGQFFVALVDEFFTLLDDAFRGTRDLLASGVRDDAVGAEFIAAPNDRYIGFDFVVPFCDEIIEIFFKSVVRFQDLLFSVKDFVDRMSQIGDVIGSDDEIEVREFSKQGIFFCLGHAPCDPDDGLFFLRAPELSELAHDFPFGEIADGAGIEDEEVGRFFVWSWGKAPFFEETRHDFGVELIHLTAIGPDVVSLWFSHGVRF